MLIERVLGFRFLQEQANGGDQGGAGAGGDAGKGAAAGAGGAADAGAGGAAGGADNGGDGGAGASLLAQGKDGKGAAGDGGDAGKAGTDDAGKAQTPEQKAIAAAEKDTRRPVHIPAKYWDADKGEVRLEAMAKSATALEKRMRDVGLPPETVDGYKFEVPKALAEAGIDLDPKMSGAFRAKALEAGLTQKQYELVMGEYFAGIASVADQAKQFSVETSKAALLAHYKTPDAMNAALGRAYKTAEAFLPEDKLDRLMATAGNIPEIITLLDAIGKEMAEDPGVNPDAMLDTESIEHLKRGKPGDEDAPYWNAKDPRHKATKAKVSAHYAAQAAAKQRRRAA